MVKLQQKQQMTTKEGPVPMMHQHFLKVKKEAPTFKVGDEIKCFIAEYENNRYCVFTASFIRVPNYHVFNSEQELHDHFDEL